MCERHNEAQQAREAHQQQLRAFGQQRDELLAWYRNQQMTWRQMMDHVFQHHANVPIRILHIVTHVFFLRPTVIEIGFTHPFQYNLYWRWNVDGRQGPPPNLDVPPPPPPPPPRPTGLAAIAADRQNVHTRAVSEQTNKNLDMLLEEQARHNKNMRTPEWFAAKWLVRSYGAWPAVTRTVNDMLTWYNTPTCKIQNDWLYRKAIDGLYIKLQNMKDVDTRSELYKRVFEECVESVGMCCEGHISRLCNVLVGFDETFAPPVPFGEILQSKMAAISNMEIPTEEKVRQATEFFNEFAVPEAERSAWLEAF